MKQREIKFRAWHKAEEKMCEVNLLRPGVGAFLVGLIEEAEQIVHLDDKQYLVTPRDWTPGRFCDIAEFELIQFTGLHDKNGKEIYEGDFVYLNHWKSSDLFDYNEPFLVTYYDGDIDFMQRGYHSFKATLLGELIIGEIIGNVFENPTLNPLS